MTVNEVGKRAMSFVPDDPAENKDITKYFVKWVNVLMAETLVNENAYRKMNGLPTFAVAPTVTGNEDEIPYNEKLVAAAFPFGMAVWIFRDEDDKASSQEYRSYYVNAVAENTPVVVTSFINYED